MSETPVAIVTGASSGVGLAVARMLGSKGWRVALAARREEALVAAAGTVEGSTIVVPTDIGEPNQAAALVQRVADHWGRLDALVNCAGVAPLVPVDKTTPDIVRDAFQTNVLGPAMAIVEAWPFFQEEHTGRIVNVSSAAAKDPFPGFFAYAATKAALESLTRSSAIEGKRHGVKAFAIAPGAIETPMLRAMFNESTIPPSKCLSPEQVAEVIVACATGERDADNGSVIDLPSP